MTNDTAKNLAAELGTAFDRYLDASDRDEKHRAMVLLERALWENKAGIISTINGLVRAEEERIDALPSMPDKSHTDLLALWDAINGRGPRCRDCADENGTCPQDNKLCDPQARALAEIKRLKATETPRDIPRSTELGTWVPLFGSTRSIQQLVMGRVSRIGSLFGASASGHGLGVFSNETAAREAVMVHAFASAIAYHNGSDQ